MSSLKDIGEPIRKEGDKDNSFCIFAVRVNGDGSTGQRKLSAATPYYLMQGFSILEGDIVKIEKRTLDLLRNDIYGASFVDDPIYKPAVNISAIVGENGSGKSTIVEYIIRLLNNLSASAFGEIKMSDSSDRLHYIDGMNGELFYMQYGRVYSVLIKNYSVRIRFFEPVAELCSDEFDVQRPSDRNLFENSQLLVPGTRNLFEFSDFSDKLSWFFYTIVSNHSIYAYNTNDYSSEADSDKIEKMAEVLYRQSYTERSNRIGGLKNEYSLDERCWLHGLFHKNDGYQVPLVLTPYRKAGVIDINNENHLAKERLVSLIVNRKSNFRVINDHLSIVNLSLARNCEDYNYERFKKKLKLNSITKETYDKLRLSVKNLWYNAVGIDSNLGKNKKYYEDAISYLTYKTVKVSKQYQQYNFFYKKFKKNDCLLNEDALKDLIYKMLLDSSHITAKIYQTLDYLAYDVYTDEIISNPINPDEIKIIKHPKGNDGDTDILLFFNMNKEALIPAPFFDVTINLQDTYTGRIVPFESLSSGEKQLTYAVSSLLYHLVNLDSVANDNNRLRIVYNHVNIILEEIELYFHPDLQKRFVKYLLEGVNSVIFESIKGLNIILVTHSPFVLSDIPSSNIIALNKDGSPKYGVQSFGANIHEMLADSFFLKEEAIGNFAKWYIKQIIKDLSSTDSSIGSAELHRRIMIIDEPVVRMTLLEQYAKKYPNYNRNLREQELLKELEEIRRNNVEA